MEKSSATLSFHKKAIAYLFDKKFIMRDFKELMPMYDKLVHVEAERYQSVIGARPGAKKHAPILREASKLKP